ncbi:MAG TPA: DUF5615 family PIN-like protein [Pirellulales bacterium]|nr:DUF5615 family PIN-like protein [Pirellulales bacterium]
MTFVLRFAADENFNNHVVRGLARRLSGLDLVRVQDVGLAGADDDTVLRWAADNDRILLTHDVTTLVRCANERIEQGLVMPGVIVAARSLAVGVAIDNLALIAQCSIPGEWAGMIVYLPLT